MTGRRWWLWAAVAALGLAASACAGRQGERLPVLAADDHHRTEGGIGGTGVRPGSVGVFGTVTDDPAGGGVNGLRVALPRNTPLPAPALEVPAGAAVAAGDVVVGELEQRRDGGLSAHRLSRFLPLVGPVERVASAEAGGLVVLGTPVEWGQADGGPARAATRLRAGDWVAVSGLWRDATVVASRVEPVPVPGRAAVSGLLHRGPAGWAVGGTRIDLRCCAEPAGPGFATVWGRYRDGRLVAERLAPGVETLFPRPVERLLVEAFPARDAEGDGIHLSGLGVPVDRASAAAPIAGRRAILVGSLSGGAFRVERGVPVP